MLNCWIKHKIQYYYLTTELICKKLVQACFGNVTEFGAGVSEQSMSYIVIEVMISVRSIRLFDHHIAGCMFSWTLRFQSMTPAVWNHYSNQLGMNMGLFCLMVLNTLYNRIVVVRCKHIELMNLYLYEYVDFVGWWSCCFIVCMILCYADTEICVASLLVLGRLVVYWVTLIDGKCPAALPL